MLQSVPKPPKIAHFQSYAKLQFFFKSGDLMKSVSYENVATSEMPLR